MTCHRVSLRRTALAAALALSLHAGFAHAATDDDKPSPASSPTPSAEVDARNNPRQLDAISVIAPGETRQVQSIGVDEITRQQTRAAAR